MKFNIKWTGEVWAITVFVWIAMIFSMYAILFGSRIDWWYFKVPVTLILVIAITVCCYMAPLSLNLSDSRLKINRVGKPILIPYDQIKDTDGFVFKKMTVRVLGSGGFFGFTGKFSNDELGIFTAYVGDTSKTFYVKTKKGKIYALSCEQPDAVVAKLREKMRR